jgi:hypothetical protein
MRCRGCGRTMTDGADAYCSRACERAQGTALPPRQPLPNQHRRTLRALLEDRPVSRAEAAEFFGWITRPRAA